jgi:hypothetical protein
MTTSHYETVATAFQVVDIADPLRTNVPPHYSIVDAFVAITEDQIDYPNNWFCLVREAERIHGYIPLDFVPGDEMEYDVSEEGSAGEHCTSITPDQVVAASMPLLDLIPLFRQHYFFFVLTKNDVTHVVSFSDLDRLPVRLCLFSLVMALESSMLDLFSAASTPLEEHLALLPAGRREKAQNLSRLKYKNRRPTSIDTLRSTTFIDKATIVERSPHLSGFLSFESKGKAHSFFTRVEEVRNQIAHSEPIIPRVLQNPEQFDTFVAEIRMTSELIHGATRRFELEQGDAKT